MRRALKLTRRGALGVVGSLLTGALLGGCGGGSDYLAPSVPSDD